MYSFPLTAGVQSVALFPLELAVMNAASFPLTFSVPDDFISPPVSPLACHLGSGVLQINFGTPLSGNPAEYEVAVSETLSGTYVSMGRTVYYHSPIFLANMPLGVTAYLRLRATSAAGTFSDWVQVGRGSITKSQIAMELTAISGSRIPAGSTFTDLYQSNDRLMGFTSDDEILFNS